MPSAVIGALRVDLDLNTAAFNAGAARAAMTAQTLGRQMRDIGAGMTRMGVGMSAAITLPLAALVRVSIPAAVQARQALAQVEAANRSMSHAAGFSTAQLQEQATALMNLSNFDDDDILQKVTANLLTFGNVSGRVFREAQAVILDVSARMGTDLQGATLMVGKALNAPVQGLAAMRRVGIQFSAQQVQQIRTMVAHKNIMGAQAVMLAELRRQFGGAAEAQRRATPGQDMIQAWGEFQEVVGEIALRFLPPLTVALTGVLNAFMALDPHTQNMVAGFAAAAAAAGPLLIVLGGFTRIAGSVVIGVGLIQAAYVSLAATWVAATAAGLGFSGAMAAVGAAIGAAALPVLAVLAAIGLAVGAVYLAWQHWESIVAVVQAVGAAIWSAIGPSVVNLFDAIKTAAVQLWNSAFGVAIRWAITALGEFATMVLRALGPTLLGILRAVGAAFSMVFNVIAGVVRLVGAILSGDWRAAWEAAKSIVVNIVAGIVNIVGHLVGAIVNFFRDIVVGAVNWLGNKLRDVWNGVTAGLAWLGTQFANLVIGVIAGFASIVAGAVEWMGGKLRDVWNGVKTGLDWLADQFKGAFERIKNFFKGLWDYLQEHSLGAMIRRQTDEIVRQEQARRTAAAATNTALGRSVAEYERQQRTLQTTTAQTTTVVIRSMADMVSAIDQQFGTRLSSIFARANSQVHGVGNTFRQLYDLVVGHSYVPDMVTEIGQHMRRLQQQMVEPARKAARDTAEEFRTLRQNVSAMLERLYPKQARHNQFIAELAQLDAYAQRTKMSLDQLADARERLRNEFETEGITAASMPDHDFTVFREGSENLLPDMQERLTAMSGPAMANIARQFARNTASIAESFAKMASDAIGSVKSIIDAFKSGDILGGIQAVLNTVGQVITAIGTIRGTSAPGRAPGYATGGSFTVGGAPGTDKNLVSMRLTKGEHVNVTRPGQGPGAGNYYDLRGAVVYEDLMARIDQMGDSAAARGAVGGAGLSQKMRRRRARHSLIGAGV